MKGLILKKLAGIVSLLCAAALTLSLLSYNSHDRSFMLDSSSTEQVTNLLGIFGSSAASFLLYFFGMSSLFLIASCLLVSIASFQLVSPQKLCNRALVVIALACVSAIFAAYAQIEFFAGCLPGGYIGLWGHILLSKIFTPAHEFFFLYVLSWALAFLLLGSVVLTTLVPWVMLLRLIPIRVYLARAFTTASFYARQWIDSVRQQIDEDYAELDGIVLFEPIDDLKESDKMWHAEPAARVQQEVPVTSAAQEIARAKPQQDLHESHAYELPKNELAHQSPQSDQEQKKETESQATVLEHKLQRFGIKGKVVSIINGPVVTLFEYQPTIDTKISQILSLEDDLALALQALSLRIIAPIPGKSVVGFEVAHSKRKTVYFSSILSSASYKNHRSQLPLILGKDTLGNDIIIDLASMPHLLVAGSTGSGKSAGLNTMLMSLLYSKSPDDLRLILIDPKRLEFSSYADIAHLVFPIITDPQRALLALRWSVKLMERRYEMMAQAGVRNIEEFQKLSPEHKLQMPFQIIVIDELADLMITSGKDVEISLARLAQMARASGIHLIIATQRPSVDVITGLIKVNFPSRLAFKVTSKVDSRTIIDTIGAEKLLGKGDMLFLDAAGQIRRVHGAYVTDKEIHQVVGHIKNQRTVVYEELLLTGSAQVDPDDELFGKIVEFIQSRDEISISLVQRIFKIGYNRSARLLDQLESSGYLMPADGSKMRKVIKNSEMRKS